VGVITLPFFFKTYYMASILVKTTDFTGLYAIAQTNYTTPIVQAYIDEFEKTYIRKLLGLELGDLFIATVVNNAPVGARYLALFNPLALQLTGLSIGVQLNGENYSSSRIFESRGMKEILKGIIYCLYVQGTQSHHSQSGVAKAMADVSVIMTGENAARMGEIRHNGIIADWEAVQYYIHVNAATYPEYEGLQLQPKYSAII
jgi:hypothetical protein